VSQLSGCHWLDQQCSCDLSWASHGFLLGHSELDLKILVSVKLVPWNSAE
jgi:hypothetical protein